MGKFRDIIISSTLVVGSLSAVEVKADPGDMNAIVHEKVLCDQTGMGSSLLISCKEVDQQFDELKTTENVEEIYKLYQEQVIQMEMAYDGHAG